MHWETILFGCLTLVANVGAVLFTSARRDARFEGVVTTRLDGHETKLADHEERLRMQEHRRFHPVHGD
jgi:hypothetical protein